MEPRVGHETTLETAIRQLWERCLGSVRKASLLAASLGVDWSMAEAVQGLISQSRAILRDEGYSEPDSDIALFDIYTRIHGDWAESEESRPALAELLLAQLAKIPRDRAREN